MISVVPDIVVFASFVSIVNILEVDNSKSIQYRCSYENDRRNDIDLWRVFYMLYIVDINQYIDTWRVVVVAVQFCFVPRLTRFHNFIWNGVRRDFDRITRLVSYYELKEATTMFELALWKSKLDQADASNTTNHSAYQIDVPGPVKNKLLQDLDHS